MDLQKKKKTNVTGKYISGKLKWLNKKGLMKVHMSAPSERDSILHQTEDICSSSDMQDVYTCHDDRERVRE